MNHVDEIKTSEGHNVPWVRALKLLLLAAVMLLCLG